MQRPQMLSKTSENMDAVGVLSSLNSSCTLVGVPCLCGVFVFHWPSRLGPWASGPGSQFKLCFVGFLGPLFNFKLCSCTLPFSRCFVGPLLKLHYRVIAYIVYERGVFEDILERHGLFIFCAICKHNLSNFPDGEAR